MKLVISYICVWCFVFGSVCFDSNTQSAFAQESIIDPVITLTPSGMRAGVSPEENLPAGAILHVRINRSQQLLDDLSKMATPFIPEKLLGPPAMLALEQPNPLLALIGMQTMGQPLTVEMFSEISGIDPGRPMTFSLYFDDPTKGFVFWIPVLNLNSAAALLQNGLQPIEGAEKLELTGGFAQKINAQDLELFVVCSEDAICICGSPALAQAVLTAEPNQKLNASDRIAAVVDKHADDDVLITIDSEPIKPMLPVLQQYRVLPPQMFEGIRESLIGTVSETERRMIDNQIQSMGVRDLPQLLDYAECFATGAYEVTFEYLMNNVDDFQGLTIAVDLAEEFQSLEVSFFSDGIVADKMNQPIPLAPVKKVIEELPGEHDYLIVTGRTAKPEKWAYVGALIDRIGQKMTARQLPMELHVSAKNAYDKYSPPIPLEAKVDWTVATRFFQMDQSATEFDTVGSYLQAAWVNFNWVHLQTIPLQPENFLESHFDENSKTVNANYAVWAELWREINGTESFLRQSSDSRVQVLADGIHQLTHNDRYTTRGGLFGYNEHEFINRYFTLYQHKPDHTVLWPGGSDAELFAAFKPQASAPAIGRLMEAAQLNENIRQIEIWRNMPMVVGFVDNALQIEKLLHKELNQYLAELKKISLALDDEEWSIEAAAVPMPSSIAHVHYDPASNEIFLVTPFGITFPRPLVLPAVAELLRDYRDVADSVGGAIVTHSVRDGEYQIVVQQSTAAISGLVRTVGNNFADEYMSGPEGQQKLNSLFFIEREQFMENSRRLLTNSSWSFLD